jgi:hypothetical protein
MNKEYKGTIIEESLEDNRILNDLNIIGFKISNDENPADRWHLYTVKVTRDDIQKFSKYIKSGKWYIHFWNDNDVIAVFKDKIFEFKYDNKETWKQAYDYGRSLGIPEEQLDFVIG